MILQLSYPTWQVWEKNREEEADLMCEWKGNSHKLLYLPCLVWPFRTRFQADLKAPYEENTETAGYQTVCLQEGQTATPTLPFLCRQSLSVFYFALNIYQNLTLTPSPYLQVWALRPLPSYSKFWSLWVDQSITPSHACPPSSQFSCSGNALTPWGTESLKSITDPRVLDPVP